MTKKTIIGLIGLALVAIGVGWWCKPAGLAVAGIILLLEAAFTRSE